MIIEAIKIWHNTMSGPAIHKANVAFDMDDVESIEDGQDLFENASTTKINMKSGAFFYIILQFGVALNLYGQNKDYLAFENKSQNEN